MGGQVVCWLAVRASYAHVGDLADALEEQLPHREGFCFFLEVFKVLAARRARKRLYLHSAPPALDPFLAFLGPAFPFTVSRESQPLAAVVPFSSGSSPSMLVKAKGRFAGRLPPGNNTDMASRYTSWAWKSLHFAKPKAFRF